MKRVLLMLGLCLLATGVTACSNPDAPTKPTQEEIAAFTGEIKFDLPEGFKEAGSTEGVTYYVSKEYPDKGSNICYSTGENDNTFDVLKGSIYTKQVKNQLEEAYEEEIEAEVLEEKFFETNGRRGFMCKAQYIVGEVKIVQIQCVLEDGDTFHFITYTEMNEEGFLEVFEESASNIRFE